MFRPHWRRAYRYVDLKIETKGEPHVIEDLLGEWDKMLALGGHSKPD